MARLQILELPEGTNDDRPPFILVIDEYTPQRYVLGPDQPEPVDQFQGVAEKIGARAILAFEETIDVPANDLTLSSPIEPPAYTLQLDDHEVRNSIAADARRANGIEDQPEDWHGILQTRRRQLAESLGISPLHDWDGILKAATQLHKQHASMRDAILRVRGLPEHPEIMDAQHAQPVGYLHGYSIAVGNAKQATKEPESTDA